MKWLRMTVLSVLCVGLSGQVSADQDQSGSAICGGYLEPDRLFGDKTNVYNRSGRRVGELKEDRLVRGRTNIYDQDGRLNGYLEQDRLLKDQVNIYDRHGRKQGTMRTDRLLKGRTSVYDRSGNREGYLEKDRLDPDRTEIRCDQMAYTRIPQVGQSGGAFIRGAQSRQEDLVNFLSRCLGRDVTVEETKPEGEVFLTTRRAIVGRELRHKSAIRLSVPCSDLEVLVPRSVNAFRAYGGLGYFHGGATLQELVIPVISITWPQKVEKIQVVLKPVEHIASLSQSIEVAPGQAGLFDSSDENLLPRYVEIKVLDPETGTLVFRSEQPAAVRPGGENVLLKLRRIPEAMAKFGQDLELRLLDVDNEEMLERKTVTLKIDLDEWF